MAEEPTPPAGRVVRTVPTTRSVAIAATALALLALAVVLIFTRDREDALVTAVLTAVGYDAGLIIVAAVKGATPPPLAIRPAELPQMASQSQAVLQGVASLAGVDAFAVAFSFALHNYVAVGFVLGTPVLAWDLLRRARRTERESDGTLWAPVRMAWSAKGRRWFLVTEAEPADAVEPRD